METAVSSGCTLTVAISPASVGSHRSWVLIARWPVEGHCAHNYWPRGYFCILMSFIAPLLLRTINQRPRWDEP
jgi:hypothetical protein